MLLAFPWLFMTFAFYNVYVFSMIGSVSPQDALQSHITTIDLMSGAVWTISVGDALIASALLFLVLEIIKTSRMLYQSVLDKSLPVVLFLLCLVEFIARPEAATSVFFMIAFVVLIDAAIGFLFPGQKNTKKTLKMDAAASAPPLKDA